MLPNYSKKDLDCSKDELKYKVVAIWAAKGEVEACSWHENIDKNEK